jgi:nucleotide-binding universal stress UspA family protein
VEKLKLLVPLDGTAFSRQIRPEVVRLFPPDRFALHLLHIARLPVSVSDAMHQPALVGPDATLYAYGMGNVGSELHPLYDEDELEDYRESLRDELSEEKALFDGEGYQAKVVVHFGEPAHGIVEYANEEGIDVLAMATHGRSGFGRLILGSVAKDVLENVEMPMLLLRAQEKESQAEEDA